MFCRPRPKHCKLPTTTQVMPAQVAPAQQNFIEKTCEYIVPEVYPTHTHKQVNHVYKHVQSYPHTFSQNDTISHQQFAAPGQVAGAQTGPGFGGGFGPGFGPGMGNQVAGAQSGPGFGGGFGPGFGPGMGGQVAGAQSGPGYGAGHGAGHGHKGCKCR
ncbi:CotD family spore coat protein [Bacillus sp. JCM 19034]|uniref:CotD family spore coat protein n=1 Tax=Bacillus sp. JCM 19034 TaxID=1481928 RepID=UPI0007845B5E|nr:CotD family spore coat protein [Bacillus sp. JCM 19034]